MSDKQEVEKAQKELDKWFLGKTSKHYESGGSGAATISTGNGDHGGVSYGTYQLSTSRGTLKEFLDKTDNYNHAFDGLVPKTKAFNHKWVELANNDPKFKEAQHDFIKASHYQPQMKALEKAGYDFSERGKAVQDMVWSTSVQYRGKTVRIVQRAEAESGLDFQTASDKDIVSAVQDSKLKHVNVDFKNSSSDIKESLKKNRIPDEKEDLLKLDKYEKLIEENQKNTDKSEHKSVSETEKARTYQQKNDKQTSISDVSMLISGLINDKDGSFTKQVLTDNRETIEAFDIKVQEKLQQEQRLASEREAQREMPQRSFGGHSIS